jgi:hypothetical protein
MWKVKSLLSMRGTYDRRKTEEQHTKIVADGCGKGNLSRVPAALPSEPIDLPDE